MNISLKKRLASTVLAASAVFAVAVAVPTPASAADACTGYKTGTKTIRYDAFAGHSVRATFRLCYRQKKTFIGPPAGVRMIYKPVISFPSRIPGSFGETLKLTEPPYRVGSIYRFGVGQSMVVAPMISSDFDFDIQTGIAGARICFTGGDCKSSWA
jgi:hypothetical protein